MVPDIGTADLARNDIGDGGDVEFAQNGQGIGVNILKAVVEGDQDTPFASLEMNRGIGRDNADIGGE